MLCDIISSGFKMTPGVKCCALLNFKEMNVNNEFGNSSKDKSEK